MVSKNKSREEKLEELYSELNVEQLKAPLEINARIAELSHRIILLKKSLKISMPEEQHRLIGSMIEHAYVMKTEKRDRYVAKNTFEKILKIEPNNPEANYR